VKSEVLTETKRFSGDRPPGISFSLPFLERKGNKGTRISAKAVSHIKVKFFSLALLFLSLKGKETKELAVRQKPFPTSK